MSQPVRFEPVRHLSILDAICVIVGIVVGSGIFALPWLVAVNTVSAPFMLLAWLVGGLLCLCGALCYSELTAAYPHMGGEYIYLRRSFGGLVGFLFVWARVTVVQTGSIAFQAYVFGSYVAGLWNLGSTGEILFALAAVAALTACNAIGLHTGKWTQNILTAVKVLGVGAIIVAGLLIAPAAPAATQPAASGAQSPLAFGLAMVFVLYAFGGWNEAAYVAGEFRGKRRDMLWVLAGGILALTVLYLVVNLAYLRALGFAGVRGTYVVAADTMARALGPGGSTAVSILVAISALGAANGCIFTGSRAMCALAEDYGIFRSLGRWHGRFRTPVNSVLAQGAVTCLLLVLLPMLAAAFNEGARTGFEDAVSYTAPVFWTFFLLTGVAVIILRYKDRHVERPFRVPFFPLTVIIFCLMCAWMLYSSLAYVKVAALVGVGVLLLGLPVYLVCVLLGRTAPAAAPRPATEAIPADPPDGPTHP